MVMVTPRVHPIALFGAQGNGLLRPTHRAGSKRSVSSEKRRDVKER